MEEERFKMKLVFFLENPHYIGGGDYCIFKIAEYMSKRGHEILIFAKAKNAFFESYALPKNLKINYRFSFDSKFKGYGFINRIIDKIYTSLVINKYLKRNKDIDFLVGYLRDSAIKTSKLGKKFQIKTLNFFFESPPWMEIDLKNEWEKDYVGKFKKSWQRTKKAYLETDILIGNSKLSKKYCEKWINKKTQGVIFPGFDINFIDKNNKIKKQNQIIYIGRLSKFKNVDEIIMALSKINNPPKLIIVGDGEEKENLIKLSLELNVNVDFLGRQNDYEKINEIKKSILMVFPSSHEGFGMPPMEAIYCGVPCICSDKDIFKEVYENNVTYFKEHDIEDFVDKIKYILLMYKNGKLDLKNQIDFVKKYSWKKSAKDLEIILSNYLKK
jgi:glycosyltransferase involved in cell wall biosynthesis